MEICHFQTQKYKNLFSQVRFIKLKIVAKELTSRLHIYIIFTTQLLL